MTEEWDRRGFLTFLSTGEAVSVRRSPDSAWVDKALARGRREAERLDPELRPVAEAGLEVLERRREDVARVGDLAFVSIASRLALGQVDEAHRTFLANQATFDDRMAELDAAMMASEDAARARSEAWERTKDVAIEFLKVAGRVAIPLLLAAL